MLNKCPSMMMDDEPEEKPDCKDHMKKGNETCNKDMAFDCLLGLQVELMNPFMDCTMMHK